MWTWSRLLGLEWIGSYGDTKLEQVGRETDRNSWRREENGEHENGQVQRQQMMTAVCECNQWLLIGCLALPTGA